jgi:pimeloyl-ACP methyl ester carboxylesterase
MPIENTYLICTRDADKKGRLTTEPGPTTFLRVPPSKRAFDLSDALAKDPATSRARWTKLVIDAADGKEDEVTGSTGDILFFVHGYNNDIPTVLWRTRVLQRTLAAAGWKGLVVGFDWPSDNSTLNYLEDRGDAAKVSARLVDEALDILVNAQFPEAGSKAKPCTVNTHLLGHSTGAYLIMEAFAQAAQHGKYFKKAWRMAQVAFIGGDVSSDSLGAASDWARPMYDRIFRLTNYSNRFDKVLGVSNMKRLGTSARAGRVGLPAAIPRKAVDVDCSAYFATKDPKHSTFTGTFNHSWHIGDPLFALDLAMTLEGGIDRTAIPTRRAEGGKLVLTPGATRPEHQDAWDDDKKPAALKP